MTTPTPLLPQFTASTEQAISEFRGILADAVTYPSRRYFIRRLILLDNLYGVDLEREAVELCKMRLHLALLATVPAGVTPEQLPDLSDTLKAGNTLVGYATAEDVRRSLPAEAADRVSSILDEIEAARQELRWLEDAERRANRKQEVNTC